MRKRFKDLATRSGAMAMAAAMAFSPCMNVMASSALTGGTSYGSTVSSGDLISETAATHNLSEAMTEMIDYLANNTVTAIEDHEYGNVNVGDKITITAEHYAKIESGEIIIRVKTLPTDPYNDENDFGCDIAPEDLGFEQSEEDTNLYEMTLGKMFQDKDFDEYKIFSNESWKLFARYTPASAAPVMLSSGVQRAMTGDTLVFYLEATENQEDTHIIDYSVEPEWEFDEIYRTAKAKFKCIHGDDCDNKQEFSSESDDELKVIEGNHEGDCVTIGKHYYTIKFDDGTNVYEKEVFVEEKDINDHLFDITAEGGVGHDADGHFEICLRDNCNITSGKSDHTLTIHKDETHHWDACDICGYSKQATNAEKHSTATWTETEKASYVKEGTATGKCDICEAPMTKSIDKLIDDVKSSISIKFDSLTSKDFASTIASLVHTNKEAVITITAEDKETGIDKIEYLISPTILTETEIGKASWTVLDDTGTVKINKDGEYYVYAKVTDKAGNISTAWLESGIIIDTVKPEITGYKEGKEYCEGPTITVKEDRLDKVKVGTTEVQLDSNKSYKVLEKGNITITVTDKAGNTTTATFKNNGQHTEEIDKKVEATCMQSGLTAGSHCKVCEEVLEKQEVIPAGSHSFKNGQLDRKSTSNLEGRIKYDCIHCDWYYYETIPVDGKSDPGEIDKGIYVYKDAPAAQMLESKDSLMDMDIFTEEELDDIEDKKAYGQVYYKITELKESDIADRRVDAMEALSEKLGAQKSGLYYFDMTLYKQIDDNGEEKISDPDDTIKVRLTIPSDIAKDNREIFLFSYYDGEVHKIEGKYNTKTHDFTFEVGEDAIYAISYKEGSTNSNTESSNNTNSGTNTGSSSSNNEDNTTDSTNKNEYDSLPDMGDTRTVNPTLYTMLLSGLVGLVTSKRKRKLV